MLSDMRKQIRVVMFIVAAAFIAGFLMSELWKMIGTRGSIRHSQNPEGYVGKIGDHNVTTDEWRAAVSYMTDQYKSQNRLRDLDNDDYKTVDDQAWRYLVSQLTWAKVLKAENIQVTQDEVMEIMRANPPADLRDRPDLMTDGKFDRDKYDQLMKSPDNREYFTRYFQQIAEMLPKEKFRIDVLSAYRTTSPEIQDGLTAANTTWKTTSLYFGPQALKEKSEPTEAEARAWYDAHKETFRSKQSRQLSYVFFPLAITRDDSDAARQSIDHAYAGLMKGDTFSNAALDVSDFEYDSAAAWVARAQLDKTTDSALAKLKPRQFSPPFLATYGWQIVQLDSLKKDSVMFHRIVVRVKMGSEALATARDSVRTFIEKAAAGKFDSVATQFGLTVQKTKPLVGDQKELPGLEVESPSQLLLWAKTAKPGQVFDQPQGGANGYYVFALADVKPAGIQEFDKVKQAATWHARQDKEKQAWLTMAKQALAAIKAGKTLEQYAQENPGVELQNDSFSGIEDCRGKKGPEFAGVLAALNPGDKYGVVDADWGAFIIRCDQRSSAGTLAASDYVDQRRSKVGQDLMQAELTAPEIKDFRDALAD
ncbi:MAG TPA: peptidylprolyl isomerase [bacterium]|nr:peptidylprolyl isomerase [bacterium]